MYNLDGYGFCEAEAASNVFHQDAGDKWSGTTSDGIAGIIVV